MPAAISSSQLLPSSPFSAKAKGATVESILAENGEDGNSWLEDIAAGKGTMLLQSLTPSTSYTMLFSMTSIYGKTKYYEFEKSTTAYPGQVVIGNYKFEDGDSTMNIGVDSIFSANMIESTPMFIVLSPSSNL